MAPETWGANRHFQGYRFFDKPLAPLLVPFDQIFFCVYNKKNSEAMFDENLRWRQDRI